MLADVRGGSGELVSPPSAAAMLAAVRGDGSSEASPPSVAAMLAAVRGEPVPAADSAPARSSPRDGEKKPMPTGRRPSVSAILAKARSQDGDPQDSDAKPQAASAPAAKGDGGKRSVADVLAAARSADGAGKAAAKSAPAKPAAKQRPSTADILAKARGKAVPAAAAKPKETAPTGPPPVPLSVPEMVAAIRAREAPVEPARPRRSSRGWWARLFGSRV